MPVLAAESTWRLDVFGFLGVYVVLVAVALGVMLGVDRAIRWGRPAPVDLAALARRPVDVAYLRSGGRLAVLAACAALHACGALIRGRRRGRAMVWPVDPPTTVPPLGRLIHQVWVGHPVRARRLLADPEVAAHLRTVEERLVANGLLMSRARRRARNVVWLPWVAVLAYGVVTMVVEAGFGPASPGPYLTLLIGSLVVAGLASDAGPASRLGRQALDTLAERHTALKVEGDSPYWTPRPANAALIVALYGEDAYWSSKPDLARALGVPLPSRSSGSGGGGDDGGGDGE